MWEIESALRAEGKKIICGVDEAGRGPLAGPVCAAAVILPFGLEIEGLDDSKKLTAKKRDRLYDEICAKATAVGVGFADRLEIDELNILNATYLAMNRAMMNLAHSFDIAIIDGNRDAGIEYPCVTVVGGDGKSASVAAASIIAKVTRDRLMEKLDAKYPGYGFSKHKGYGTKEHYAAIRALGVCPEHRVTFLRKMH
jgi:ribonuclease HII